MQLTWMKSLVMLVLNLGSTISNLKGIISKPTPTHDLIGLTELAHERHVQLHGHLVP